MRGTILFWTFAMSIFVGTQVAAFYTGRAQGVQHERAEAIRANVAEYATVLEGDVPTPRFRYQNHLPEVKQMVEKAIVVELPSRTFTNPKGINEVDTLPVPCEQCQREISFGSFKPWNELPEPK